MLKRAYLLLLVLVWAVSVKSQVVGDWNIYPVYSTGIKWTNKFVNTYGDRKVVDTPSKVYILAGRQLFSIDKSDELGETKAYTSRNALSDNRVTNIYYNYDKKYLVIVYESNNVDLLYDDEKVVNMSDIRDAVVQKGKDINDVAFHDDRIYMATAFGLVVYDDEKHSVIESGIYDNGLEGVAIVGDKIIASDGKRLLYSNVSDRHVMQSSFTQIGESFTAYEIEELSDDKALVRASWNDIFLFTFDFTSGTPTYTNQGTRAKGSIVGFGRAKDCFTAYSNKEFFTIDWEGKSTKYTIPTSLQSSALNFYGSMSSVWVAGAKGIGNFDLSKSGSATVLRDFFIPQAGTNQDISGLTFGKLSGKLYSFVCRMHTMFNEIQYYGENYRDDVNTLSPDGTWETVDALSSGTTQVRESPTTPGTFYVASHWGDANVNYKGGGIQKFVDGKFTYAYDKTNSTFNSNYGLEITDFQFDKDGNLWAVLFPNGINNYPYIHMLPADKVEASTVTKSDWKTIAIPNMPLSHGMRLTICTKSDIIFVMSGSFDGTVTVIDTNGTPADFSDDRIKTFSSYVDQDGKAFTPTYVYYATEDENGKVWFSTSDGVFEITNPDRFIDNPVINHIKVPRNDGTNLADYLLDGITVTGIAVDSSNRKWVATATAGVYLVSEDGSEILEHFDTSNSYLPVNKVYTLATDPYSSKVYFGTSAGLVEYTSDSSPAASDYSDVYAYPNPVRPGYTGWITVTGLMDNSLVKIVDASGNTLSSGMSEGGMYTWDGCNQSGARVKTGVYYVYASQNADGSSSGGVVTKILVVN